MKKHRTLKLYLLVSFLTIVFVFIGANFAHAQKAQMLKKPPKTPEYTWSMTIPSESLNVRGMDYGSGVPHTYKDGIAKTNIRYKEYTRVKGTIYPNNEFLIGIDSSIYPQSEYVDIWGVLVDSIVFNNNECEPCGFPPENEAIDGGCLENFLNGSHPHPDYDQILFRLTFLDRRLEEFEIEEELEAEGVEGNGLISILIWDNYNFVNEDPDYYHAVNAKCNNENMNPVTGNSRYYIIRTGKDTWKFFIENQVFDLREYYFIEEKVDEIGNSGKDKYQTKYCRPQTAKTTLSFVLELTRHTNSNQQS